MGELSGLCTGGGGMDGTDDGHRGPRTDGGGAPAVSLDQLLLMSPGQIEAIYRQGAAVPFLKAASRERLFSRQVPGAPACYHEAPV